MYAWPQQHLCPPQGEGALICGSTSGSFFNAGRLFPDPVSQLCWLYYYWHGSVSQGTEPHFLLLLFEHADQLKNTPVFLLCCLSQHFISLFSLTILSTISFQIESNTSNVHFLLTSTKVETFICLNRKTIQSFEWILMTFLKTGNGKFWWCFGILCLESLIFHRSIGWGSLIIKQSSMLSRVTTVWEEMTVCGKMTCLAEVWALSVLLDYRTLSQKKRSHKQSP